MKVLIIDDSPDAAAIARARLIKESLEIVCADGGHAGLEKAQQERPDLILLDLDMPDLSGHDVCRRLKADPELCMIPVIFLSGSGGVDDKVKGLDLGAVDYVTKPFDAFELQARARAALRTKHLQDLLVERARMDPLTELWNRRGFMERLEHEWARLQRHDGTLAIIMADVDHFKDVNDRYGHPVGDQLLREVATVLAGWCRQPDLPARYGGEEFAILLPDELAEGAAALAERYRREIEDIRLDTKEERVRVTASFGIADSTDMVSYDSVIRKSDAALYRAKQAGRNRVETDPSPAKTAVGRSAVQSASTRS